MKTAIMQPYFFPYIGYFQLISAVDLFVIYDDVNFIKKGWIARNNLLVQGKPFLFGIALESASQNKRINEINLSGDNIWKQNVLKTIAFSYRKAPFFDSVFPLIESILGQTENNIARFVTFSIRKTCEFIGVGTEIIISSDIEKNNNFKGSDKIIEICRKTGTTHYINAIGGMELYDTDVFEKNGIGLEFIQPIPTQYPQFGNEFVPWLSIIDILMFNSIENVGKMLTNYTLLQK